MSSVERLLLVISVKEKLLPLDIETSVRNIVLRSRAADSASLILSSPSKTPAFCILRKALRPTASTSLEYWSCLNCLLSRKSKIESADSPAKSNASSAISDLRVKISLSSPSTEMSNPVKESVGSYPGSSPGLTLGGESSLFASLRTRL